MPAGKHSILIPAGSAEGFHARFEGLLKAWQAAEREQVYVVKPGDNLSSIAAGFGIPLPLLLKWNNLDVRKPIFPGDRLMIYVGK